MTSVILYRLPGAGVGGLFSFSFLPPINPTWQDSSKYISKGICIDMFPEHSYTKYHTVGYFKHIEIQHGMALNTLKIKKVE